jgi:hypothetical protein
MGKNQSASGLTNIVQYDTAGNISLVSGSTVLLRVSSSGAITTTGVISGSAAANATSASYALSSSYATNATNATSASYWSGSITNALSASYAASASNALNTALFNNTASSVFATTGSNTFTGTQYVSNTNNAIGFSNTTSSIYTDGGLQVTKDAYISSSLYIKGNLTVYGTQSVSYITSSQLNISTNLITVNTTTPSVRFGGIAVQDSGSASGLTGSLLWDSQTNNWIYNNPSGSGNYDSAMVMMGPQNSSGLGNEVGITLNAIPKGAGGHHMTSSVIFDVSGSVGIGTSSPKTYSSLTSTGQIIGLNNIGIDYGQSFRLNNYYNSGTTTDRTISTGYAASIGLDQTNGGFTFNISSVSASTDNTIATTERLRITSAGKIGIGTTTPDRLLTVNGDSTLLGNNYISTSKFFQWEGGAYWTTRVTSTGNQFEIYRGDTGASPFIISSTNAATFTSSVTASTSITVNNSGAQEAILSAVSSYADGYRAVLRLNNTHTGGKKWEIYSTNNSDGVYSGGKLAFVNTTDSVTAMTITAAGKVGIGVTAPSKLFEVSGRMSTTAIVSTNLIAGQISSNLLAASSPNYILLFNMTTNAAGWSMAGYVNAAAWDCWNISTIWVRKLNDSFTVNAGVTGLYKSGCDFAICDITYGGARYIALRFTSNPEIDVLWTGYGLSTVFQGDGTATVVNSGVTVNTIYAAY